VATLLYDPTLKDMNEIKQALETAISAVGEARDCQPTWPNLQLEEFTSVSIKDASIAYRTGLLSLGS
jgi:hypothetical protein